MLIVGLPASSNAPTTSTVDTPTDFKCCSRPNVHEVKSAVWGGSFGESKRFLRIIGNVCLLAVYVDRGKTAARFSLVFDAIFLLINFCAALGNHTRVGRLICHVPASACTTSLVTSIAR